MGTCRYTKKNGKGFGLEQSLPTPKGDRRVSEIKVGDYLYGFDGKPTKVTGVFRQTDQQLYEIEFNDGRKVVTDSVHKWLAKPRVDSSEFRVMSTPELRHGSKIPSSRVEGVEISLPLDPYTIGVFIGDGGLTQSVNLRSADQEIVSRIIEDIGQPSNITDKSLKAPRYYWAGCVDKFRELGLWGKTASQKRIPEQLFNASRQQRLNLLHGLMDTDGCCTSEGQAIFSTASEHLRDDFIKLVRSLGMECTYGPHSAGGWLLRPKCQNSSDMFWLERKKSRGRKRKRTKIGEELGVKSVNKVGVGDSICFSVEAEDSLFVGPEYVVTHNTELAAALGVYLCVDDEEPSAKVVCGASSDEQADLLFSAATKICDWSPTLSDFSDPKYKHIKFDTGDIAPGELRRVAAVAGSNDGKNLSGVLIDELHEWIAPKSRAVFTVLTQGGGARRQPINIMITTAGSEEDSICYEFYELGLSIRSGEVEDDTFYFLWFEAPAGADYTSVETWKAANPSWGLILNEDFYKDIITKRSESEFCRYFLNMWMESDEIWEAAQFWPKLAGTPEFRTDRPTYVGIDIGRRHDSAAVIVAQWDGEKLHVRSKFWINPNSPGSIKYKEWALNVADVEQYLKEIREELPEPSLVDEDGYREPGPVFLYDPHFFARSAELLSGEGLSMVEFPQSDSKMVPASQNIFELVKTGRIVHDGHDVMNKHMRTVVAKYRERGWRIHKPDGSRKHIDGAIALAMAAYAASAEFEEDDTPFSIF